jgi:hypothetical protein
LNTIAGAEYRLSTSATWQSSNVFSGLSPETDYQFYAHLPETATHTASPESAISAIITTNVAPAINNVEVTPATVNVQKGSTQQFNANVTAVGGAGTTVTWSMSGNNNASTTVSASGLLTVATAETATSLTVKATSTFDNTKYGTATVTVTDVPVTPEVISVTVTPPTAALYYGENTQFSANVTAVGGASTAVTWSVTGNNNAGTTINASGMLSVSAAETANTITVRATSVFDGSKFGTATVTLSAAPATPEVISVTITPASASVLKGYTEQFVATVAAVGGADESVMWSVLGADNAGTTISSTGLLSVDINETATVFTVAATSVFNSSVSGTATVNIVVTGIETVEGINVSLYPNPFADYVRIAGAEGSRLQVINLLGAAIYTTTITSDNETVNLGTIPTGTYLFRIIKDGKTATLKGLKK